MHILWSLIRRDVTTMPRRERFYYKRVAFAGLCALLVLTAFSMAVQRDAAVAGLEVFRNLSFLLVLWACLVAPQTASQSLTPEREHHVLGLLLLSDMKLWQLLLGKLIYAMSRALLGVLAAIPMIMLCVSLGGISTSQIWLATLLLIATIFAGICLGLLAATVARSEVQANGLVMAGALLLYLLVPFVLHVLTLDQRIPAEWPLYVSPALAMNLIVLGEGRDMYRTLVTSGAMVGIGLVLMAAAAALLPLLKAAHHDHAPAKAPVSPLRRASQHRLVKRLLGIFGRRENILLWREFYIIYGGFTKAWQRFAIVFLLCLAFLGFGLINLPAMKVLEVINYGVAAMAGLSLVVFAVLFTTSAARMLQRERQAGTLDILLCTSLPEDSIVDAKLGAIYLALLPWLLTALFGGLWLFVHALDWDGRLPAVLLVLYSLATWYVYSGLVLYLGTRLSRYVEVLSLVLLVLWLTVGQALLTVLGAYLFFIGGLFGPAIFILGPIACGYALRRTVKRQLRHYMLMQPPS